MANFGQCGEASLDLGRWMVNEPVLNSLVRLSNPKLPERPVQHQELPQ